MLLPVVLNAKISRCGTYDPHNKTTDQKRLPDITQAGKVCFRQKIQIPRRLLVDSKTKVQLHKQNNTAVAW